jgi:hypothetical protein
MPILFIGRLLVINGVGLNASTLLYKKHPAEGKVCTSRSKKVELTLLTRSNDTYPAKLAQMLKMLLLPIMPR